MAARARSAPPGRSKWPLEPAQLGSTWLRKHRTCRRLQHRACSAPLGRSKWLLEPARLRWGARNGRSSPLGSTGALKMAARACSAPPGRSKLLDMAARKHCICRRLRSRARSAPLGRPTSQLEPARLRWAGDASLGRTTNACFAQQRDEHSRAWNARAHTSIYIYIYMQAHM